MDITFSNFKYSPTIRSRRAELLGLRNLQEETQRQILPHFMLGKWPRSDSATESYRHCVEALYEGAPFILDITREPTHVNPNLETLRDHANGFENWRRFVEQQDEDFVPAVLFSEDANIRDVIQQAIRLESSVGKIAVHVNLGNRGDLTNAQAIAGAIDDPANALFVLNVGYLSSDLVDTQRSNAITAINLLRSIDRSVDIVITGSSFPRSVSGYGERNGLIPIQERTLFLDLGGDEVVIYGDHASIHPKVYEQNAIGYVPRIDYPCPECWLYERRRGPIRAGKEVKAEGYTRCAQAILELESWDSSIHTWGTQKIQEVAEGNTDGMGSPANWIGVRVNIHLHQQVYNPPQPEEFDDDIGSEGWDE